MSMLAVAVAVVAAPLSSHVVQAAGPPFSSYNCSTLPKSAFEPVTLKNSVRNFAFYIQKARKGGRQRVRVRVWVRVRRQPHLGWAPDDEERVADVLVGLAWLGLGIGFGLKLGLGLGLGLG